MEIDMNKKIGVGLVGSQFISTIHAESLKTVHDAEILAVVSPSKGHAHDFAEKFNIHQIFIIISQTLVKCWK
jgi:predicted dehydrogenase